MMLLVNRLWEEWSSKFLEKGSVHAFITLKDTDLFIQLKPSGSVIGDRI